FIGCVPFWNSSRAAARREGAVATGLLAFGLARGKRGFGRDLPRAQKAVALDALFVLTNLLFNLVDGRFQGSEHVLGAVGGNEVVFVLGRDQQFYAGRLRVL